MYPSIRNRLALCGALALIVLLAACGEPEVSGSSSSAPDLAPAHERTTSTTERSAVFLTDSASMSAPPEPIVTSTVSDGTADAVTTTVTPTATWTVIYPTL